MKNLAREPKTRSPHLLYYHNGLFLLYSSSPPRMDGGASPPVEASSREASHHLQWNLRRFGLLTPNPFASEVRRPFSQPSGDV